jgi:hypothetical protein
MEHSSTVIALPQPPFPYTPPPCPVIIQMTMSHDVSFEDWLLQLFSGTLGAVIGAVVVWRVFVHTRAADRIRDKTNADTTQAIAKEQRRVDLAADFVTQLQERTEAHATGTGLWGDDIEQFQRGVVHEVMRLSTRLILDDPSFSRMLGTMSANLKKAPVKTTSSANDFIRDVDAVRMIVTEWAKEPSRVTSSEAAKRLASP